LRKFFLRDGVVLIRFPRLYELERRLHFSPLFFLTSWPSPAFLLLIRAFRTSSPRGPFYSFECGRMTHFVLSYSIDWLLRVCPVFPCLVCPFSSARSLVYPPPVWFGDRSALIWSDLYPKSTPFFFFSIFLFFHVFRAFYP